MYLHVKTGFYEVDRWDGTPVGVAQHQKAIERLAKAGPVVVVRCRRREQLEALLETYVHGKHQLFVSPPAWDYQFRVYLGMQEWAETMAEIALDLTYRNFKNWCLANAPDQYPLAHRIWDAVYPEGRHD